MKLLLLFLLVCVGTVSVLGGPNAEGLKFLEENRKKEGVIERPSGLQYKVLKKGDGLHHPTADSPCSCHYHGMLIDGSVFDSSVDRGQPIDFAPNQVIRGWTEIMTEVMVEGDKVEMYIPSDLAYGDHGSPPKIGGGDTLIFQMELLEIKGDKVPAMVCDTATGDRCNDKEKAYIEKQSGKTPDKLKTEIDRLTKMQGGKMKPELSEWLNRRLFLLKQMAGNAGEKEEL